MFLMNNNGGIVNVSQINAFCVRNKKESHEITVYTPMTKYGVDFYYDNVEQMEEAARRLTNLVSVSFGWIKIQNWSFASTQVDSISMIGEGARVRMIGGESLDIIAHSSQEREEITKCIHDFMDKTCKYMKDFMYPEITESEDE